MSDFLKATEAFIATWHNVHPANEQAREMAADLTKVIAAFEAQRGKLVFEEEPSSFEAALLATRERA